MVRLTLILSPFLFSVACSAQVSGGDLKAFYDRQVLICGGWDSIFNIKGKWKKSGDDLAFPDKTFARSQYKYINARVDSISDFVKAAVTDLSGVEATTQRGIRGDSYIINGPVPYSFRSCFFDYYCNDNYKKIILGDETSNWIYFFVNNLNWFLDEADEWDINNDGIIKPVFQLPAKTGEWKGVHVYEPKFFSGGPARVISRSVIIGRNGKLPWRSLTQKQYLTGLKNDYEKKLVKFREGSSYEDYKQKLNYINDYFAATNEDTLEKIAVIDPKAGIWGFKGKFGKETEGGFRLILFGAGEKYFDKNLARHTPQLIQVMWKYNQDDTVALKVIKQFEENFPLDKLKAMIR